MNDRNLERLRELKSTLTSTGHALDPLENRFSDEVGIIFWLKMARAEVELRIEEAKEALNDSTPA